LTFTFNKKSWQHWLLLLLLLVIAVEFLRDIFGTGDFVGYINAGNNVINGLDIYGDYLNTWPPLFSIFSAPLALIDNLNGVLNRAIWLAASIWALYWIIKISAELILKKEMLLPFQTIRKQNQIAFSDLHILLPFLFIFRYVLDNMANIQINIFMLAMAMGSLYYTVKNRVVFASFLLALSVSLKVFTIFLIPFYLYKRKWRLVIYTLCWIFIFGLVPFLVFGQDIALSYYQTFYIERAQPFAMVLHKNQSLFALFRSLLMNESRGFDIFINVKSYDIHLVKKISYIMVGILASIVVCVFSRDKKQDDDSFVIQTFFVLTAIPILSPLAWKAYFIFLWPGYFWVYFQIWGNTHLKQMNNTKLKILFALSLVGTVLSSEIFVGGYISDLFEIFASITLGTIILLLIYFILFAHTEHNTIINNVLHNEEPNQIDHKF
jgi:hypothetical protein